MTAELLLEIGTEEIPSGYFEKAMDELKKLTESYFLENRIYCSGGLYTYHTPRRLILVGKDIAEQQEDMIQEVTGPPKKAAYDKEGNPTKAAMGFARKYEIPLDDNY